MSQLFPQIQQQMKHELIPTWSLVYFYLVPEQDQD